MINKLHLKNFQAHKNTSLSFSDGLNVIIGDSDQGKSSIIRSLYWLFFNQPSGNEFINRKSDWCSVKAIVDKKETIERFRNKSKNRYVINDSNFDAIRTDVPNELKEVINIKAVNIQLQDDPYFLLSSQPGEIARSLNKVVGLDQIDSSLKYVNSLLRKENSDINNLNEYIQEKEDELSKYKNLDKIESRNNEFKQIQKNLKQAKRNRARVKELINKITDLEHSLEAESSINAAKKIVQKIEKLQKKMQESSNKQSEIKQTIKKLKKAQKTISKIEPKKKQIDDCIKQIEQCQKQAQEIPLEKISNTIKSIKKQNKIIKQHENDYQKLLETFQDYKSKIKFCPTCEQKLQ